jgi:hypothetical protein
LVYILILMLLQTGIFLFLDFKNTLHKKDGDLLDPIKKYFCVGAKSKHVEQSINYGIRSIKNLQLIINQFYKFTLKTSWPAPLGNKAIRQRLTKIKLLQIIKASL